MTFEDLDLYAVVELPEGDVCLPRLVGKVCLEADVGALGALMRLRGDEPSSLEDAPDRRHRRDRAVAQAEVIVDGVGTGIEAGVGQLLAEAYDAFLELHRAAIGDSLRCSAGPGEGAVAPRSVAGHELCDPRLRDPVRVGDVPIAAAFQHHRVETHGPRQGGGR
jgi:hypothetical protein